MFPETLEKTADNELPSFVQSDPSRPSALQRLSEPSQDMKKAIAGLVNYQVRPLLQELGQARNFKTNLKHFFTD